MYKGEVSKMNDDTDRLNIGGFDLISTRVVGTMRRGELGDASGDNNEAGMTDGGGS